MNEMLQSSLEGEWVDGAVVKIEPERPNPTGATEGTISANVTGPVDYPFHSCHRGL